jgi:hypothetical protein
MSTPDQRAPAQPQHRHAPIANPVPQQLLADTQRLRGLPHSPGRVRGQRSWRRLRRSWSLDLGRHIGSGRLTFVTDHLLYGCYDRSDWVCIIQPGMDRSGCIISLEAHGPPSDKE